MANPQPAILFCFNRPEETAQVCEALATAEPRRIYVCADGPRNPDDEAGCKETLRVAREVLCERDVEFLVRDSNLGCRASVLDGLDWFFQHEEMGIILEDDCLPSPDFFGFADELLLRFKDDPNVAMISGDNFGWPRTSEYSYSFSRYTFIWGWATWQHQWNCRTRMMQGWHERRATDWLARDIGLDGATARYWTDVFDRTANGEVRAWSYEWLYSCWVRESVSIVPSVNLVTNIGFGDAATNTQTRSRRLAGLPRAPLTTPLRHPPTTARDISLDRWAERHVYRTRASLANVALREGVRLKHLLATHLPSSQRERNRK